MLEGSDTIFVPHGNYTIDIQDNIVKVVAEGAWNLEAKKALITELTLLTRQHHLDNWQLLADVSNFELGTPEFQTQGYISKYILVKLGLQKIAYLNRSGSASKLRQLASMQTKALRYQWRFFADSHAAQQWLISH